MLVCRVFYNKRVNSVYQFFIERLVSLVASLSHSLGLNRQRQKPHVEHEVVPLRNPDFLCYDSKSMVLGGPSQEGDPRKLYLHMTLMTIYSLLFHQMIGCLLNRFIEMNFITNNLLRRFINIAYDCDYNYHDSWIDHHCLSFYTFDSSSLFLTLSCD